MHEIRRNNVPQRRFLSLHRLLGIALTLLPLSATAERDTTSGDRIWDGIISAEAEPLALPTSDVFKPLLADPKETHFYMSHRWYNVEGASHRFAAVGLGERFGFYRRRGHVGEELQFGIAAGVLAQFDLEAPSSDLVNADYLIGFPITYRNGRLSTRLRIYHQSSHLGDEFLLRGRPERINLSYEAVDAIVAYDFTNVRLYGGGEYLFHREPAELDPGILHAGAEYAGAASMWGGRLVAGVDLKSFQEHEWNMDVSLNVGVDYGRGDTEQRRVLVLIEAFKGFSPHGQFYDERIRYYGARIVFGF